MLDESIQIDLASMKKNLDLHEERERIKQQHADLRIYTQDQLNAAASRAHVLTETLRIIEGCTRSAGPPALLLEKIGGACRLALGMPQRMVPKAATAADAAPKMRKTRPPTTTKTRRR